MDPLETTWEAWTLGGGPAAAFERPDQPLEVEIGPGEDEFLLDQALSHPDRNWLGIEYSRKRVHRYVRKTLQRAGPIGNLRLIWRPASDVVRPFLTPDRVRAYHVYFPDPWPKKHHHRYRLLTPSFFGDLRDSLVRGGRVHLLTDHEDYVLEIVEAAAGVAGLRDAIGDGGYEVIPAGERPTVFERRWRAEGLAIYRVELLRG